MPTITPQQLAAMSFGYLTGQDLIDYCSTQLLISQYNKSSQSLQDGCNNAQSEMIGYFYTKYDVMREFNMISGPRQNLVVQLTAILAVRNILRNVAGIGPVEEANFAWAENIIERTLNGTFNLPLHGASCVINSGAGLVGQNFRNLG